MFFERVLNTTVRYDSDEGHFFATPECGKIMGSSEGPIFFLAAYALPIIRWNLRTMAWEEEHLPLLQGVTTSGLECDLGLSAFADDVVKKVEVRSEEELFEALEHSDRVLDEELAGRGWKRNMDKREVVPTMRERGRAFDLAGKKKGHCGGSSPLGWTLHVERQQTESDAHCVAFNGQVLDGEGTLGQETCHLWLQGARSCGVGRRRLMRGTIRRCST